MAMMHDRLISARSECAALGGRYSAHLRWHPDDPEGARELAKTLCIARVRVEMLKALVAYDSLTEQDRVELAHRISLDGVSLLDGPLREGSAGLWTAEEDELLRTWVGTDRALAAQIGRSIQSIRTRRCRILASA